MLGDGLSRGFVGHAGLGIMNRDCHSFEELQSQRKMVTKKYCTSFACTGKWFGKGIEVTERGDTCPKCHNSLFYKRYWIGES